MSKVSQSVAFPFTRNTLKSLLQMHDDKRNTLRMLKNKEGHLSRSIRDVFQKTLISLSFVYTLPRLVFRE